MKSLPLAVKVGGAGALGGGGIAGAGLLIYDKVQKSKTESKPNLSSDNTDTPLSQEIDLDQDLKNETTATLKVDPENSQFEIDGNNKKHVTLTIKAVSASDTNGKFSGTNWTCKIKGSTEVSGGDSVGLSEDNFKKAEETPHFVQKLTSNKNQFIESCKKWRTAENKSGSNWTSEIVMKLTKEGGSSKYKFSTEDITSLFAGTWDNTKQQ